MKAPNFRLLDQNEKAHSLDDFKGKWLIVYFYPKDDTPGCTKEACGFRDALDKFKEQDIEIVGISKDSLKSHQKFATKFNLNFPLLSDESLEVIKSFGAWGRKKFMGKEFDGILRKTYIVNPEQEIVKVYEKVDPVVHAEEILKDIKILKES